MTKMIFGAGQKDVFLPELGVIEAETFSSIYPSVNDYLLTKAWQPSRDGNVKEVLDMKTHITNPYRRCVGGFNRNANIFFLLAEAMWIACGKRDVNFLTIWNKKMAEFSDNGIIFHAPYGFRLRHWGVASEHEGSAKGFDQVVEAIRILSENPNTRQVVMEIWNPELDLGCKTKDIPCNDIVMFKIREGKLITTIGNRSNDLHLGLPTNIFQFSFLSEIMAACLGIELGTQTHNSQSLHVYDWNKSAKDMHAALQDHKDGVMGFGDMYETFGAKERHIDFNFSHELPVNRFREVEGIMEIIISNLTKIANGGVEDAGEVAMIESFSRYLFTAYKFLKIFLDYRGKLKDCTTDEQKDAARFTAISEIEVIELDYNLAEKRVAGFRWDIAMLAKNFFFSRFIKEVEHPYLGRL